MNISIHLKFQFWGQTLMGPVVKTKVILKQDTIFHDCLISFPTSKTARILARLRAYLQSGSTRVHSGGTRTGATVAKGARPLLRQLRALLPARAAHVRSRLTAQGACQRPHPPFSFGQTCRSGPSPSSPSRASSLPVAVCPRASSGGPPSRAPGEPAPGGPG